MASFLPQRQDTSEWGSSARQSKIKKSPRMSHQWLFYREKENPDQWRASWECTFHRVALPVTKHHIYYHTFFLSKSRGWYSKECQFVFRIILAQPLWKHSGLPVWRCHSQRIYWHFWCLYGWFCWHAAFLILARFRRQLSRHTFPQSLESYLHLLVAELFPEFLKKYLKVAAICVLHEDAKWVSILVKQWGLVGNDVWDLNGG